MEQNADSRNAILNAAEALKSRDAARESAIIDKVVAYLRKEAAAFDDAITEGEALGEDVRWAKVKRMSVNAMADRIERGDWKAE